MKDYNEMAKAVFERRDEYFAERQRKQAMFFRAGLPICSLVLVTMMGLLLWNSNTPVLKTTPPELKKYKNHSTTEIVTTEYAGVTESSQEEEFQSNGGTTPVYPQTSPRPTEQGSQSTSQTTPQPKPPSTSNGSDTGDAPATSVPDPTGGNEGDCMGYPQWPVPTDAPMTEAPTMRPPSVAEPTTEPTFAPPVEPTVPGPPTEAPTTEPEMSTEENTFAIFGGAKADLAQTGQKVVCVSGFEIALMDEKDDVDGQFITAPNVEDAIINYNDFVRWHRLFSCKHQSRYYVRD